MDEKLFISKEKFEEILNEEKNFILKTIEDIKLNLIEKICKEELADINLKNFFNFFPQEYLKILKEVFEQSNGKINLKSFFLVKIREKYFPEDFREKTKELEEYFVFEFIEKNIGYLIKAIKNFYEGKTNTINISFINLKIKGLYGEKIINEMIENFLKRVNYKICFSRILEIYKRFEKNLEENFYKVKDKLEIPPLLFLQMNLNSLNKKYPNLFQNLNKEDENLLKGEFLKLKERGILLCWLYSFTKFFIDEGIKNEISGAYLMQLDERKLKSMYNKFLMGMDLHLEFKYDDLSIIKKAYIFKKIIIDNEFMVFELAEEQFKDDYVFLKICKEIIFEKYQNFIKKEILPFLRKNRNLTAIFRNFIFSPDFFTHNEILPFFKLKRDFLPFLEKEEAIEPFKDYDEKIILELKDKIQNLKQNFSKISLGNFKKSALKIFEEISNCILLWEDYEILLKDFSKEFLHLPQIPSEVLESFSRISFNYLSILLNEATFLDFPQDAKPQITLFETLKIMKEKGKIILLSDFLKNPISYSQWEEFLFEFKLSTPYRDFYNYIKNFVKSKGSLQLLKIAVEVLEKEDFDLSISQKIFQALSFFSDIREEEFFNLIFEKDNFPLQWNELKEKIFAMYPYLDENLQKTIKEKGLYSEALEIEYTKKEKTFLNFLKELKLSRSFVSFNDYLKITKFPYRKEEKVIWEEFFIPIKHYLIQIEPKSDGFSITLNISGQREGPHPFEGQLIKNSIAKNEDEISWILTLYQKYASFLLELEDELFVFDYIEPKKKQKYKMKTKKIDKTISFKRKDGKFLLKLDLEKQVFKKIWAKAWGPFYATDKDETEAEKDIRFILSTLKNVL